MVKAVNKLILEINNTENEYFEKAIFYIRPEKASDSRLNKTAEDYLKSVSRGTAVKSSTRRSPLGTVIISIAAALFSATATSVIFMLCG